MKIILNQSIDTAAIQAKIKNNGGYCPCSLIQNDDTKCMCKEFRESTELGECHCGLYIRVEN